MIIINSLNESRFTLNNVQYFKNYTTRVAGDKLTIYNAYDNKDVLVPLTPLDQFRINGSVYETIDELQIAIIGICYTRTTLEEGSPSSQNNVARLLSIGIVDIIGSDVNATSTFYAESVAAKLSTIEFTITATEAPVIVYAVIDDNGDGINSLYSYFFTGGKGTYTNVLSYQLLYINDKKYTVDDIENNPTANIISLGDLPTGDYLTKANSVQRDFNDAGELDENGNLISYYLSYTTDNVLYFVQFVGAAGSYNGTLTANDFVSTTNSNVVADINYENVLQTGNFASIGAIHKDADSGMITEFHGSGFGSTLGDYTQKFLVDTPIGDYTITFPAATQNDNVVYESTLHEGLNSLGLQAVTDTGATTTNAITTGGLTIPANTLNITGGDIYNYIRADGTTGEFGFSVNTSIVIHPTTDAGSTEQVDSGTLVRNAFYQLQNQINTNADNTIPLSGTEVGSPVTGDIEFEDGQFLQLKQGNGYIAFTDDDRIEIDIDGSGFDFGGSSATIRNATGSIDIAAGIDSKGLSGGHDYTSNITDLDYVQKKYVDDVAIQDLQNVTDTGATTTNAITTGGLTIPENTLNITGGSSTEYIKGNGTTGIFVADVRTSTMGTDNTAGDTTPLSINSQITVAIYRLQNMINANADNAIPLSGTEVGSPLTGNIEVSESVGMSHDNGIYSSYFILEDGGGALGGISSLGFTSGFVLGQDGDFIFDTDNPSSKGLSSSFDYTANITDLDYTQKKYVDDNFLSLSGTEASNPITGDIEFDASTTIGIKADAGGQITFNNTDGVRIQGNAGGVSIGGNTLGIAIEGEGGDIDISVGSDSKISLNGNLNHDGDGQNSIFYANGGQYEFGGNGNFKGIEYTEDYSSNYTNRSLVDKKYVDEHAPRILHNSVTDSAVLTGTTDDTILKSFLIPAGTISDGILSFAGIFEKAGAADQVSYRVSINTTNSISGSTRIATLVPTSPNFIFTDFRRDFILNNGTIYGFPKYTDSNNGETSASSSPLTATLDTAADFYVIVSAALNDATDSVTQKSFKINFEKATE